MNKIVRDRYPVEKLPEDLRQGFARGEDVRVTVEPVPRSTYSPGLDLVAHVEHPTRIFTFEEIFAAGRPTFQSVEEVVTHVRAIRDEAE